MLTVGIKYQKTNQTNLNSTFNCDLNRNLVFKNRRTITIRLGISDIYISLCLTSDRFLIIFFSILFYFLETHIICHLNFLQHILFLLSHMVQGTSWLNLEELRYGTMHWSAYVEWDWYNGCTRVVPMSLLIARVLKVCNVYTLHGDMGL